MAKCHFCDGEIKENALICKHCGKQLADFGNPKNLRKLITFGEVLAILLIIWGVIILIWTRPWQFSEYEESSIALVAFLIFLIQPICLAYLQFPVNTLIKKDFTKRNFDKSIRHIKIVIVLQAIASISLIPIIFLIMAINFRRRYEQIKDYFAL